MKGVVFTQFLDFVEEAHGLDMVDDIIDASGVESGGAYTAVGTYPTQEMVALVTVVSERLGVGVPELLRRFGHHLCRTFVSAYPQYFAVADDLYDFLASVDGHIHIEVRKLYPGAELPSFKVHARRPDAITLDYRSARCLEALATGLIEGAAEHYGQPVRIRQQILGQGAERVVRFEVAGA